MISVEEARERILALVSRLAAETRPLREAHGQVLAEAVVSPVTIPPLDNTAMDGYAVQSSDTEGASEASRRRCASPAKWPRVMSTRARSSPARPSAS